MSWPSIQKASAEYGWLLTLVVAALALAVVYTRPIDQIPATEQVHRMVPASPGLVSAIQLCKSETASGDKSYDAQAGADRYTVVDGVSTLQWLDNSLHLAIVDGQVVTISEDVEKCLRDRL